MVVDLGFTEAVGTRRGRQFLRCPSRGLAEIGIDCARVEHVILTHFHYDHVGNYALFPRAVFYVQDDEMAFYTGRYANQPAFRHSVEVDDIVALVRYNYEGRLVFVDGDQEIVPGICVHKVGGHTAGMQVVSVHTREGRAVVASDASHYYHNFEKNVPFMVLHDLPGIVPRLYPPARLGRAARPHHPRTRSAGAGAAAPGRGGHRGPGLGPGALTPARPQCTLRHRGLRGSGGDPASATPQGRSHPVPSQTRGVPALYRRLEERILARDQLGASQVFYDLVRAGRPLPELLRETVRIHGPYTHVPYHQRLDQGFVRFVNNDHCLLSARTSLRLPAFLPSELHYLPMAQTIWYVPTGLDPWNQLLGKMPGHYARRTYHPLPDAPPPPPQVHWPDQEPRFLDGPYEERLNTWLTLVERGQVLEAYRVFLGLFAERRRRPQLLAHLAFAGLIDVQDRMLYNRSYTTGHKAYRARATIELGEAVGWERAHPILYAGVPDMAVGPRWYSAYEMACQVSWTRLAEEEARPASSLDPSPPGPPEARLLANRTPLTRRERRRLLQALTEAHEPDYIEEITALLRRGKDPLQLVDTLQVAAARILLEVGQPGNFSMPQHGYEYTNTLRWFFDTFAHPLRLRLLYVAGSFVNQCAWWVRHTPGNGAADARPPRGATDLAPQELLRRLDAAMVALRPAESVAWTRAYLKAGYDRKPLLTTLALGAVKQGNDPHNQEIGLCLLEDYLRSTAPDRDVLLLACAQHTAGHVKYGDPLECYRRFMEAFGLSAPLA
ncbi:MAG: hypothetical protein KatS3mg131_3853 [Candidatus Tectimicrobiota bacterium]|nr:MAG: hypothetical protein KatS3mg131_3853 [Candidatus Tectomicrobia bacterium]